MSRPAAFALLLFVAFPVLAADPPALTNYQGVLRGAAAEPLTGDFDMVFRFFDTEPAGNEILIDQHFASDAQAVTVDGGLFSVALGGGQVVDGSGPGTFTLLAGLFRDHSGVWLEVLIGAGSGTAIEAPGPYGGGYFGDSDDSAYTCIGYGDYGMQSFGTKRRTL